MLLVQVGVIALVTIALLEGIVALSFAFPTLSPLPLPLLRTLYQHFDRRVIQVMPACAIYDERITYRLRPGTCMFENREFANEYRINSLGVRDDEDSLRAPAVVMLGDSVTMGWGVEQDQAYPAVFERLTGKRVLNAGISSFGTVRELRLLERIDRSRLEHLVIQYTDNDVQENEAFLAAGELRILGREEYEGTVVRQQNDLRYIPGKYALNVLVQLRASVHHRFGVDPADATANDWNRDARTFIDVLKRSPVDLGLMSLTVVSLHSEFISALRETAMRSDLPWIAAMRLVDAGRVTQFSGAFYLLDDHPTAAGQHAIARELARALVTGQAQ